MAESQHVKDQRKLREGQESNEDSWWGWAWGAGYKVRSRQGSDHMGIKLSISLVGSVEQILVEFVR